MLQTVYRCRCGFGMYGPNGEIRDDGNDKTPIWLLAPSVVSSSSWPSWVMGEIACPCASYSVCMYCMSDVTISTCVYRGNWTMLRFQNSCNKALLLGLKRPFVVIMTVPEDPPPEPRYNVDQLRGSCFAPAPCQSEHAMPPTSDMKYSH